MRGTRTRKSDFKCFLFAFISLPTIHHALAAGKNKFLVDVLRREFLFMKCGSVRKKAEPGTGIELFPVNIWGMRPEKGPRRWCYVILIFSRRQCLLFELVLASQWGARSPLSSLTSWQEWYRGGCWVNLWRYVCRSLAGHTYVMENITSAISVMGTHFWIQISVFVVLAFCIARKVQSPNLLSSPPLSGNLCSGSVVWRFFGRNLRNFQSVLHIIVHEINREEKVQLPCCTVRVSGTGPTNRADQLKH